MPTTRGPFRADQIRPGDPYELSNGHAVYCMGTGGRGSRANLVGGSVLDMDPAVEEAGIDTGYAPSPDTLRAPDVAVGNVPDAPGWVDGAPPLAVEYADTGQDEKDLTTKISELFAAGIRLIWAVRLTGPRHPRWLPRPRHAATLARRGGDRRVVVRDLHGAGLSLPAPVRSQPTAAEPGRAGRSRRCGGSRRAESW